MKLFRAVHNKREKNPLKAVIGGRKGADEIWAFENFRAVSSKILLTSCVKTYKLDCDNDCD